MDHHITHCCFDPDFDAAYHAGLTCPRCGGDTVYKDDQGRWACTAGCNLSRSYFCPVCGRVRLGTQGYCDDCIDLI